MFGRQVRGQIVQPREQRIHGHGLDTIGKTLLIGMVVDATLAAVTRPTERGEGTDSAERLVRSLGSYLVVHILVGEHVKELLFLLVIKTTGVHPFFRVLVRTKQACPTM